MLALLLVRRHGDLGYGQDAVLVRLTVPQVISVATRDADKPSSNSASPYCAVLSYADPTNSLSGYTVPTCDSVPTTYKFYFSSFGANSPTTRSSSSSSRSTLALTRASSSSDPSSTGDADQTQSTPATSSTAAPGPVASSGSSTPVGPIVGGVVGGVGTFKPEDAP